MPFALNCDYLAAESFVEETKPIFSRFRRGYLLHMYNVQPSATVVNLFAYGNANT